MKGRRPPVLYGPHDAGRYMRPTAELRGALAEQAEKIAVPPRFDFDLSPAPMVRLTDLETGRQVSFPLCDYRTVRMVLADLFSEKNP